MPRFEAKDFIEMDPQEGYVRYGRNGKDIFWWRKRDDQKLIWKESENDRYIPPSRTLALIQEMAKNGVPLHKNGETVDVDAGLLRKIGDNKLEFHQGLPISGISDDFKAGEGTIAEFKKLGLEAIRNG